MILYKKFALENVMSRILEPTSNVELCLFEDMRIDHSPTRGTQISRIYKFLKKNLSYELFMTPTNFIFKKELISQASCKLNKNNSNIFR